MNDNTKALVLYRMERAREALRTATLLFQAGDLNAYVNRLYYACFYAVSALLVTRGVSTSKHGHLRSLLHRDFVKTGLIPNTQFNTEIGKIAPEFPLDATAWSFK